MHSQTEAISILLVALVGISCSDSTPSTAQIAPASELQEELDLYAHNRPTIQIPVEEVPPDLHDLIPFAEQWGIPDDIIRHDVFVKATQNEKEAFRRGLVGRTHAVTSWLDSFPPSEPMPDSAAHFMYMLEALDENGLWPDR
jgi:hypothetical protein